MAIDTVAKRKSMLSFGGGDLLLHPDGTIDATDRITLLELYAGIAAGSPVLTIPGLQFTMDDERLEFTMDADHQEQ